MFLPTPHQVPLEASRSIAAKEKILWSLHYFELISIVKLTSTCNIFAMLPIFLQHLSPGSWSLFQCWTSCRKNLEENHCLRSVGQGLCLFKIFLKLFHIFKRSIRKCNLIFITFVIIRLGGDTGLLIMLGWHPQFLICEH